MAALVSFFFSQLSVAATMSSFLDVPNFVKCAVLHLIDRTFIVDILIFFASGPGLRLMSPERNGIIDNLCEFGNGEQFPVRTNAQNGYVL